MLICDDLVLSAVHRRLGELGIRAVAILTEPLIFEHNITVDIVSDEVLIHFRLGRCTRVYVSDVRVSTLEVKEGSTLHNS